MALKELFTDIADALRAKTGRTDKIVASDFPSVINGLSIGTEGGIIPSGTKQIVTNGTHNVSTYEYAEVNVPVGITPSGTLDISSNGIFDVTNYISANVAIPTITVVRTITLSSDLGSADPYQYNQTVISGDDFIKEHYNDVNLSITMIPVTPFAADANVMQFIRQGNSPSHKIGSTDYYGVATLSQGASNATLLGLSTNVPLTSRTYSGGGFLISSSGAVNICGGGTSAKPRIVKAGTYLLIMTCPA